VSLIQSPCGPLVSGEDYKANEANLKKCRAWLGPNQPGITTPDPTAEPGRTTGSRSSGERRRASARDVSPDKGRRGRGSAGDGPGGSGARGGGPRLDQLPPAIRDELAGVLDELPAGSGGPDQAEAIHLLDFLLAP
jgi:hypothetical protein